VIGQYIGITVMNDLTEAVGANAFDAGVSEEPVSAANEGASATVCEKLLLQVIGRDDGNDEGRGRWSRSSLNSRNFSLVPYLT